LVRAAPSRTSSTVPARRGRRRKKRSPLLATLVLFSIGFACLIAAGLMWLYSPDATTVAGGPAPRPKHTAAAKPPARVALATAGPVPPTPPSTPHATPAATTAPSPSPAPTRAGTEAAASPEPANGRPRLAIIIDDCGQWPVTERGFVALPFPVTLSVLPHVRYGPEIAREADAAGKGVMLHLPMQTISGRYPGPGTITVEMGDATIRDAVAGDLAELPEARGVNNHEGSLATENRRVMGDVADVLVRDGRFWIDSRTSSGSIAADVTRLRGVPTASRDVFLDDVDNVAAVEAQLREAAARARESGSAIAIGHPRPATLLAVRTLAPALAAHGIDLTLASNLVH
jgi:polysaccharide deacetylase 2 family uncharacterized protein YibQ